MDLFKKKDSSKKDDTSINIGRISIIPNELEDIYSYNQKTLDILKELKVKNNVADAIDTIVYKTPDGKMAFNTYLRLANNGINIQWYRAGKGVKSQPIKKYDAEFREFASRIGKTNSSGLDGIIDELHGSAITHGGMGVEVVIENLDEGIDDIYLVDPVSIVEWKWIPEKKRYAAYQQQQGEKRDLFDGNFFFVPFQPKIGHPDGTFMFEPAILAITQQQQFLSDSWTVLHRIGYPRYHATVDSERIVNSLSDKSSDGIKKAISSQIDSVAKMMRFVGKDNDFVTSDAIKVETLGGGANGSGIDIRAWNDVIDVQVMNSFQILQVLMNRLKSGSYALSSVEFKIVTDTIESMRRGSKRIIEDICRMWARVNGYQIIPKVEFNPIDWKKELDKLDAKIKLLEINRRAEEYGYIGKDEAASNSMGVENADNQNSNGMFEYIKKNFKEEKEENDITDGGEIENGEQK